MFGDVEPFPRDVAYEALAALRRIHAGAEYASDVANLKLIRKLEAALQIGYHTSRISVKDLEPGRLILDRAHTVLVSRYPVEEAFIRPNIQGPGYRIWWRYDPYDDYEHSHVVPNGTSFVVARPGDSFYDKFGVLPVKEWD